MSTWRVERHYGFGAAQIPIQPEAHRAVRIGFAEGVGFFVGELTEGGPVATMRRVAGEASALLLSLLILLAFIVTLTRDHSDRSAVEVVLLVTAVPEPLPIVEEPPPIPIEIAKPEPPKAIVPEPPPTRLVERPKPPPPPAVQPKPRTKPRPKPAIPQIARIEAPKPRPLQRLDRDVRERAQPIARPRVAIDAARPEPSPTSTPPRMDRIARAPVDRPTLAHSAPRLNAPAAPALDMPSEAPPERSFRLASAQPRVGERPRAIPGIAPAPRQQQTAPIAPNPGPTRASGPRPAASLNARRPIPTASPGPVPVTSAAPVTTAKRGDRQAPRVVERRAPRPSAQVARAAASVATPTPNLASRSGREAPEVSRGSQADRPGVAGVPLGDLAACLSDREEDRLKQAVVAAVTTQEECVSSKGTYRFIETKNLNAFLMWIDRARARPVSDRCVELGYALECLESAGRRAAR